MRRTRRKPRPIERTENNFRDDRLFIVACDDTYAPDQYFGFFQIPRVQVHVVPTEDGTSAARHVLSRLLDFDREEDDQLWLLLDTDHYTRDQHFPAFINAINDAKQSGVNVALSKPCFELWLLLHHIEGSEVLDLRDAKAVEAKIRSVLGQYDKRRLREQDYPLPSVVDACVRAEKLDEIEKGGDRPEANTSRVYLLWRAIADKALPSQLPPELRALKTSEGN